MASTEGIVPEVADIREGEEFDAAKLCEYLRDKLPSASGEIEVRQFPGGHSNLTYLVKIGEDEYVLRRPPLGQLAHRAHDMGREYRVLSKLYQAFPKAPRGYHFCEDDSIIGAPFVVMERKRGIVVRNIWPEELDEFPNARRRASEALVDTIGELHNVDYEAIGLGDFGRPEGFVLRQITSWDKRWHKSKVKDLAVMDELARRYPDIIPEPQRYSIVHNDFKLDNVMLDKKDPGKIVGVFDWEMSALGDPLIDFGITLSYWSLAPGSTRNARVTPGAEGGGFLNRDEVIERYQKMTKLDLSHIQFFESFAYYKTAIVLQQIYIRFHRGQTKDKRFAAMAHQIEPLAMHAKNLLDQYEKAKAG